MPHGPYRNSKYLINRTKRDVKNAVCNSLRAGSSISKACADAGIDRASFYRWHECDVHFRQAVYFAKKARIHTVEDALYKSAVEGDVQAQKFFLVNRSPEEWKERGTLVNQGIIQQGENNAGITLILPDNTKVALGDQTKQIPS